MNELEIKKTIEIDASPEVVFRAISDPKELTNWFPDAVILEAKVGGKSKFSFYKDSERRHTEMDRDFISQGKVLEFIPNRKLSYTWQWKGIPEFAETVVTWELESLGKNKTRLTLIHTGFTGKEGGKVTLKDHSQGWEFFLGKLVKYCERK